MKQQSRVLPAGHEFVKQTLRDFRVLENGRLWVARLKGEGRFRSSVFPELAEGENRVLVELIPSDEWQRPSIAQRWLTALRLPYLSFSLLPILLVLCARARMLPAWPLLALLLTSVTLIHLGCNLWGDYEDHLRGVDSPEHSGGSGVVHKLWIPAVHLRNSAALLFLLGCVCGVLMLWQLPFTVVAKHLLWLGLLGALGAASYSGWPFHYKYFGFGEPVVFLLSGPIVTLGAAVVLCREPAAYLPFALYSLPLAFPVVLRLHGGNMQRIPFDSMARVVTIARLVGFPWSRYACVFLTLMPFLATAALVLSGIVTKAALTAFLAAPFAWQVLREVRETKGPLDPACHGIRRSAARFHLAFGLLYALSFLSLR